MNKILYAQFTAKSGYEDVVAKMVRQLTDDVRKEPVLAAMANSG